MTTQKLSSEKLLDLSLFKNLTRRRIVHILIAFLMNFFTISVPIMMAFGDFKEDHPIINDTVIDRVVNDMQGIMVLNLVFSCMLAVYFGIITLGYMMNRRSAHFYHALPQKRETLYMTSIASSLFCAVIGAAINLVVVIAEILMFGIGFGEVIAVLATLLFKNLIMFIAIYAITVFAGSFSGNGLVQVLMTLVITLYPLVTYLGVLLLRSAFSQYFQMDFFLREEVIQWLSPFAYVIVNYIEGIKVLPTVIAVLVSAALILGGNEIYSRRAIENSERPIMFKKLGSVLKYMLMFTVTAYAGMFFYAIGYGVFHLIFGFVCGAVLSFMLFNTILEKSPKAMFKGAKGLAIFAAVFAVYALIFCFDVFKMDEYVPDAEDISYAQISISEAQYDDTRFDDPEMLKALSTVLKNQRDSNNDNIYVPVYTNNSSIRVEAVMFTKLGLPIARTYTLSKYTEGTEEFLKLYADDERMQEEYTERIAYMREMHKNGYTAEYSVHVDNYREASMPLDEFLDVYVKEFGVANYERLSKPLVGYVSVYNFYMVTDSYNNYYRNYSDDYSIFSDMPIYEDMTETIAFIESAPAIDENTGEVITQTEESAEVTLVEKAPEEVYPKIGYVYDTRKLISAENYYSLDLYPRVEISSELTEELYKTVQTYSSYSHWRVFTAIDTDYALRVYYDEIDEEMEMKYGEGYNSETYVFSKGKVPESVKALFN